MHDYNPGELLLDASVPNTQVSLAVKESSQVAEARQRVTGLARGIGFNETDTGRVALAVTELATNLVKYATNGALVSRVVSQIDGSGVEILALDTGPGMANVTECLRDGYSTTGSPGTGLGAVLRLSSLSEIYSAPGKGTAMLTHFQPDQLQEQFDRQLKRNALSSMTARLHYWDFYRDRHEELTKDPEATFRRLFGEEFAKAYEEQLRRLKADRRNAAAAPRSSDT